ncbi:MAG: magnesium transporter CorA family protein [bacterium]|nr:magnesium transporter CorA family protein [bacterium]
MRIIEQDNFKWIDILKPDREALDFLRDNFNFHPLILKEAQQPTLHPMVERYEDYLYLILHFPDFNHSANRWIQTVEIDFLITRDALITIRYQDFVDFEEIFDLARKDKINFFGQSTGHLFYHLVRGIFAKMHPEIDYFKTEIDELDSQIFQQFEEKYLERIAWLKRQILNFIRAIKSQKGVWETLPLTAFGFWGRELKPYFSDLVADYSRLLNVVETNKEVVDSLYLTLSSILDNKQNHVMRLLTIFTAIILPLSLFASVYGMNLINLPLAGHHLAFWFFLFGMITVTVLMLIYFRRRKWF